MWLFTSSVHVCKQLILFFAFVDVPEVIIKSKSMVTIEIDRLYDDAGQVIERVAGPDLNDPMGFIIDGNFECQNRILHGKILSLFQT